MSAFVETAISTFGRIDVLVNNASTLGGSPMPKLEELGASALFELMDVNVRAPLKTAQIVLPHMRAQSIRNDRERHLGRGRQCVSRLGWLWCEQSRLGTLLTYPGRRTRRHAAFAYSSWIPETWTRKCIGMQSPVRISPALPNHRISRPPSSISLNAHIANKETAILLGSRFKALAPVFDLPPHSRLGVPPRRAA